jgi:hypothetical protein
MMMVVVLQILITFKKELQAVRLMKKEATINFSNRLRNSY